MSESGHEGNTIGYKYSGASYWIIYVTDQQETPLCGNREQSACTSRWPNSSVVKCLPKTEKSAIQVSAMACCCGELLYLHLTRAAHISIMIVSEVKNRNNKQTYPYTATALIYNSSLSLCTTEGVNISNFTRHLFFYSLSYRLTTSRHSLPNFIVLSDHIWQ